MASKRDDVDVDPLWRESAARVRSVLSEHVPDLPYWSYQLLAGKLCNMARGIEPAIAGRREREHHRRLSLLRDKAEALLRALGELDEHDRRDIDAAIVGAYALIGEGVFTGERADAIVDDLAQLHDALSEITAVPPDPPKRGKPRTLRGDVSSDMYHILHRAGVTDPWKCCQIIVDVLDGDVADKIKRVNAMYNRLSQLR